MGNKEGATDSLLKSKLIRVLCHLYDGKVAISMGMEVTITRTYCIMMTYRDHYLFYGHGGTLLEVFSELMGRKDGCSHGKGGSVHFYKKENKFYEGNRIMDTQDCLGCSLHLTKVVGLSSYWL